MTSSGRSGMATSNFLKILIFHSLRPTEYLYINIKRFQFADMLSIGQSDTMFADQHIKLLAPDWMEPITMKSLFCCSLVLNNKLK